MNDAFEALHGFYLEDLEPGMSASVSKAFTDEDVAMYARLSLDDNPLHMDDAFAARTRTGGRVVHGMITASLISAIIGTRLPGPGCLWMAQDNRFLAPVRIGETVRATATIDEIYMEKQRARLTTICEVREKAVLEGHALVWVPSRSAAA